MNIQIIYSMLSRVLAASGAALLLPLLLSLYEQGPMTMDVQLQPKR